LLLQTTLASGHAIHGVKEHSQHALSRCGRAPFTRFTRHGSRECRLQGLHARARGNALVCSVGSLASSLRLHIGAATAQRTPAITDRCWRREHRRFMQSLAFRRFLVRRL